MHNCKTARSGFIDLALDEITPEQSRQLLAELNGCLGCQQESAAVRNVLHVSTQALRSEAPSEGFWPGYHDRLRDALLANSTAPRSQVFDAEVRHRQAAKSSRRVWLPLRALLTTSVRVPVPAALLVLVTIAVFGLRSLGHSNEIPATPRAQIETRTVTVPVVQEKVITRVVYVPTKISRPARRGFDRLTSSGLGSSLASITPGATGQGALNLAGFAPTDKVKLTVIKGSYRNEK